MRIFCSHDCWSALLVIFFLYHGINAYASCAKAELSGGDCSTFSVRFDITQCGDFSDKTAKISCSDSGGKASLATDKAIYEVNFLKGPEVWGKPSWTIHGEVMVASIPQTEQRAERSKARAKKSISRTVEEPKDTSVPLKTAAAETKPERVPSIEVPEKELSESKAKTALSLYYDVRLQNQSNGLERAPNAPKPAHTTDLAAKAYIDLNIATVDDVAAQVYINVLAADLDGATEVATARKNFAHGMSLAVGKSALNMGGWDAKDWTYSAIVASTYTELGLPLPANQVMLMASEESAAFGTWTLQVTDDKVLDDSNFAFNQARKQPAALLEWTANYFGSELIPLVQVVPYDAMHSLHFSVGFKFARQGWTLYLDYLSDRRRFDIPESSTETDQVIYTQYLAKVSYQFSKMTAFGKYVAFDGQQKGIDAKGNILNPDDAGGWANFEDNGSVWTAGFLFEIFGNNFVPYLAFIQRSAKMLKDPSDPTGPTELQSNNTILGGVQGAIN